MLENIGIIIINENGSEELTKKCVASLKKQDYKKMKVSLIGGDFNKSEIINKGIETFREFDAILLLEVNQELKEGYVSKCLKILNSDPLIGAVYTDYENSITSIREYLPSYNRERMTKGFCIPNTSLISMNVFKAIGLFDSSLEVLENWDMWLRISESFMIYHIPESLYINNIDDIYRNISSQDLLRTQHYILDKTKQRINGKR